MKKSFRIAFVAVLALCFLIGNIPIAQATYNDVVSDGVTSLTELEVEAGISCSSRDREIDCFCPGGCCRNQTSCWCC
ncbi:MAG TPA: hypothetical protein VLV83_05590 [Acidobacteriota bacterium]|nr:hypothetical protein [Acidobacteriota bacterium]